LSAFWSAILLIALLGSIWSALLVAQGWWSFGEASTGVMFGTLVLEEAIFYPSAGALCIGLYVLGARGEAIPVGSRYLLLTHGLSVGFGLLLLVLWHRRPYYLLSQLVLFNFCITLPLARFVARAASRRGVCTSILWMSVIGIFWDAHSYGSWWTYHAGTGIEVANVPIDDLNFFFFAPAAAISIYEGFRVVLGSRSPVSRDLGAFAFFTRGE
jgi:hypothetical protein